MQSAVETIVCGERRRRRRERRSVGLRSVFSVGAVLELVSKFAWKRWLSWQKERKRLYCSTFKNWS